MQARSADVTSGLHSRIVLSCQTSANLYIISTGNGESKRLTNFNGYDGAPSWAPDGKKIAFESCQGDPDNSSGTKIYVIDGTYASAS